MTRIDVLSYELLDEARNMLAEFRQMTTPNQIMNDGTPAWQLCFGFELLIDKSNVMVNNRVAVEMDEAHETLTTLVKDLSKACDEVRSPPAND